MDNLLEKINKSAIKFLAPLTPIDTYKTIVKEAIKLIDGNYGNVLLEQNGEIKRVYASIKMAYGTKNRKRGNTYKSFVEQKVIVAPIKELGPHHPEMANYGVKWTIFIPLVYQKKSIGVLTVNTRKEEKVDRKQYNALKLFGSLASLAIVKTQALDEIQKALETRDLFISLASHELKTPLTSVNGYVQLIQKKAKNFEGFPVNLVDSLAKETHRLTNLINELLEINQVKTGTFNFNWVVCSLGEIIDRAVTNFKLIRPQRTILFNNKLKDKPDFIIGDSDKLLQVILNVLHNAAKFSPEETIITVTLDEDEKCCVIKVKDRGTGIDKKDLPNIFKDFYKGNSNSHEGMGLGLFLTKHIIDSHKGIIKVKSIEHRGTTIEFQLPKVAIT